jgi:hypothetical protein
VPGIEVEEAPVAVAGSPETAPDATDVPAAEPAVEMTCRLAPGANGALGCGIAAPILLALAVVAGLLVSRMNIDPSKFGPQNPPPLELLVLTLVIALCLLLGVVAGFIGVFWGRSVIKRIRTVPGAWIGLGRARAGWVCGLVTLLLLVAWIVLGIGACLLRAPRA